MTESTITDVLAANLAHFMAERKLTQMELAKRSGVGQTTVGLYLSPQNRKPTHSGRLPAPTLANVQLLADALEVHLWELLRPLSQSQRDLIKSVDAVIAEKVAAAKTPTLTVAYTAQPPPPAPEDDTEARMRAEIIKSRTRRGTKRERDQNR